MNEQLPGAKRLDRAFDDGRQRTERWLVSMASRPRAAAGAGFCGWCCRKRGCGWDCRSQRQRPHNPGVSIGPDWSPGSRQSRPCSTPPTSPGSSPNQASRSQMPVLSSPGGSARRVVSTSTLTRVVEATHNDGADIEPIGEISGVRRRPGAPDNLAGCRTDVRPVSV